MGQHAPVKGPARRAGSPPPFDLLAADLRELLELRPRLHEEPSVDSVRELYGARARQFFDQGSGVNGQLTVLRRTRRLGWAVAAPGARSHAPIADSRES